MWFASLARGRAPRGLRDLATWGIGYTAQLAGFFFLLTDRYPTSDPLAHVRPLEGETPPMSATGVVTDDLRRSRLTVFFRVLLWIPHLVWFVLWTVVAHLVAVLNWFGSLILGRSPQPFARFLSAYVRYTVHQLAFVALVGNPFPGFDGKAGSYPVDVQLDPFGEQRRVTIVFRLFLAVPALIVASAAGGVLFVTGFLGWFASLVRGQMPQGLRNAGAWALAYSAQATTYLFVLSDRYPFSSPAAVRWSA
jgi:hypothetical protein